MGRRTKQGLETRACDGSFKLVSAFYLFLFIKFCLKMAPVFMLFAVLLFFPCLLAVFYYFHVYLFMFQSFHGRIPDVIVLLNMGNLFMHPCGRPNFQDLASETLNLAPKNLNLTSSSDSRNPTSKTMNLANKIRF